MLKIAVDTSVSPLNSSSEFILQEHPFRPKHVASARDCWLACLPKVPDKLCGIFKTIYILIFCGRGGSLSHHGLPCYST